MVCPPGARLSSAPVPKASLSAVAAAAAASTPLEAASPSETHLRQCGVELYKHVTIIDGAAFDPTCGPEEAQEEVILLAFGGPIEELEEKIQHFRGGQVRFNALVVHHKQEREAASHTDRGGQDQAADQGAGGDAGGQEGRTSRSRGGGVQETRTCHR